MTVLQQFNLKEYYERTFSLSTSLHHVGQGAQTAESHFEYTELLANITVIFAYFAGLCAKLHIAIPPKSTLIQPWNGYFA